MKKILVFISVFSLILTAGCGSSNSNNEKDNKNKDTKVLSEQIDIDESGATMICTIDSEIDEDDARYTLGSKYIVFSEDGKNVTSVKSQEIIQSSDNEILSEFEQYLNDNYTLASNYGGYEFEITNKNGMVISTVTIDYTKMNIESYINDYSDLTNYLNENNQFTISTMKDMYESMGATCTEK